MDADAMSMMPEYGEEKKDGDGDDHPESRLARCERLLEKQAVEGQLYRLQSETDARRLQQQQTKLQKQVVALQADLVAAEAARQAAEDEWLDRQAVRDEQVSQLQQRLLLATAIKNRADAEDESTASGGKRDPSVIDVTAHDEIVSATDTHTSNTTIVDDSWEQDLDELHLAVQEHSADQLVHREAVQRALDELKGYVEDTMHKVHAESACRGEALGDVAAEWEAKYTQLLQKMEQQSEVGKNIQTDERVKEWIRAETLDLLTAQHQLAERLKMVTNSKADEGHTTAMDSGAVEKIEALTAQVQDLGRLVHFQVDQQRIVKGEHIVTKRAVQELRSSVMILEDKLQQQADSFQIAETARRSANVQSHAARCALEQTVAAWRGKLDIGEPVVVRHRTDEEEPDAVRERHAQPADDLPEQRHTATPEQATLRNELHAALGSVEAAVEAEKKASRAQLLESRWETRGMRRMLQGATTTTTAEASVFPAGRFGEVE